MKQNNALFLTAYRGLVVEFRKLGLDQIAVLAWSMIKTKQTDRSTILAIYKRIHTIL